MPVPLPTGPEPKHLKTFSSLDELKTFLKSASQRGYVGGLGNLLIKTMSTAAPLAEMSSDSSGGQSYSTTNIQVEGVDEADIVKSDGKYIYVVSGSNVSIIDAYPVDQAKILSIIKTISNLS